MKLGWKVLIPAGLVWLLFAAAIRHYFINTETSRRGALAVTGVIFVVLCLIIAVWPERKPSAEVRPQDRPYDAFAGGFPVPPLPGQQLPGTVEHEPREVTSNARE
jgi:NADH-quinone oxidoreductase subunit H